jgi:hypothetical protein
MIEFSLSRIMISWLAGFLVHSIFMQFSSTYGSPRGYFLMGAAANAIVFFSVMIVFWPVFAGGG